MKIKILTVIHVLLCFVALLMPIQAMFVYTFNLPNYVQVIYLFVVLGISLCFFLPYEKIIKNLDKTFIILFILLLISIFLSMIVNYDRILESGMDFTYFCRTYSKFWDKPNMRLLNWGIIRPWIFFIYILLLFIFLPFKNTTKKFIKSLVLLAVCTSIYSVYQIVAFKFSLPFASLFSGHSGETIAIFGLRRVEGLFYEPGPQATFLSPIFCVLFSQIFETKDENLLFKRKTLILFLFLISFALFMTISPIAFLTPLIAIPLFIFLNKENFKFKLTLKKIKIIISSIVILIVLISSTFLIFLNNKNKNFAVSTYIIEKIFISMNSMDSPIVYKNPDSRSVRNYVGLKIFKDNKLLGVGQGGAISHFSQYSPFAFSKKMPETNGVINTHIKILCELGLIGTFFYILILVYPFYLYIKKHFYKSKNKLLIDGLIIGYLIYLLVSFQATLQFWMPYFWMIYVLLILLLRRRIYIE